MGDVNAANRDGLFRAIVHNVENVPSTERFRGLPDPYVNLFYHGILSKISVFCYGVLIFPWNRIYSLFY